MDNLKKIPSVQLTVVDKNRDKSEKSEKETCSVPKVTITAIGSSQSNGASKKEDSPTLVNRKRKLENENGFLVDSSAEKIFTPNKISRFEPVLDHPIELRKLLFEAYINKANNNDELDNKEIVLEIVNLRAQRANLLGFETNEIVE